MSKSGIDSLRMVPSEPAWSLLDGIRREKTSFFIKYRPQVNRTVDGIFIHASYSPCGYRPELEKAVDGKY